LKVSRYYRKFLSGSALAVSFLLAAREIGAQADFYKGKTIKLVAATQPGGTSDMRIRAILPFLEKYIPGNPTSVVEYMPGGGDRKAANYLYNTARPDGLTIGALGGGLVANAIGGETGVMYDIDRFIYLGSGFSRFSAIFVTRKEAGLDSLEKLRAASGVRIGADSVGHHHYIVGRIFAWIGGLKDPRFVTGYSGPEVDLALLRGELDARSQGGHSIITRTPEWIEKGLVHFHAIFEIPKGFRDKHPLFESLPAFESRTRTDAQRRVLALYRNFRLTGSPFVLPPATPKERAEIMKEAFRRAWNDAEFAKKFQQMTGAETAPLMPDEQAQAVREIPRDAETIKLFNRIAGSDPLPPS
jgi:tripartite-type tricarboxylate transporter receptor subunit TctC